MEKRPMETEVISFTTVDSSPVSNVALGAGYSNPDSISKTASPLLRDPSRNRTPSKDATSPEERAALRQAYEGAVRAASILVRASLAEDVFSKFAGGAELQRSLERMWELRRVKDEDQHWKAILSGAMGIVPQVLEQGGYDVLPTEACRSINDLVTRCLSLSTKGKEETVESTRLIRDAGFSPFHFISGDPGEPEPSEGGAPK
jgi:hypothetical protein